MKNIIGLYDPMVGDILIDGKAPSGLDPITAANLDRTILALRDTFGFTFVVVTHELRSIFTIADSVVMLDPVSRSIIAQGNRADLREHSDDPRVRPFKQTSVFETCFDDSVSGLAVGSPVEFRGIPPGDVTEIFSSFAIYESDVPFDERPGQIVVRAKVSSAIENQPRLL